MFKSYLFRHVQHIPKICMQVQLCAYNENDSESGIEIDKIKMTKFVIHSLFCINFGANSHKMSEYNNDN